MNADYFPLKLAQGNQFCNRAAERTLLKHNIERTRHTVLVSPRRYGKSSLVHQVATELKMPFISVDLFLAYDDKTIINRLIEGISSVINQIIPFSQKTMATIQKYFKNFKILFNANGINLEISHQDNEHDYITQLFDALKSLAKLAKEHQKQIIFFIDEFQDISNAENAKTIQGTLRHIAQETNWIAFIFSGSNRHLLLDLFNDRNKPLYMICDKIFLDRITYADYEPHLQLAAKKQWKKTLDEIVINRILHYTELHPFYVNLLCSELWKLSRIPSLEDVNSSWLACYEMEERRITAELSALTVNQQSILKALAANPTLEPTSHQFSVQSNLSPSSIRLGIKSLLEKDLIYLVKSDYTRLDHIKKGQYRVLDPLISFTLRKFS